MTAIPDVQPPEPDTVRDAASRGVRRSGPGPITLCPFVVGGDGTWRSSHASRAHRCCAVNPPARLAISKQRQLCLVDAHRTCATYLAARALDPSTTAARAPDDAGLWPDSRPTVVNLEQGRIGFSGIPAAPGRSGGQALLVGLMVLALLVLVVARTTTPSSPGGSSPPPASAVIAAASPLASSEAVEPTLVPTTAPSTSPPGSPAPSGAAPSAPASSPGPEASAGPASPSPAPSDARLYKVRSGDTLSTIALKFGVTVKAIKLANGITDPRLIRVGRVLVIP